MNEKDFLAQGFTIPGSGTGSARLVPPSGTSPILQRGGETAGKALAQTAFDWFFYIAIILAVLFIMWSGIQWMTSGGDVVRLQSAKKRLFFAIIGLVIVMFSFVIVRVVLTTLGANSTQFFSPFGGLQQSPIPSP